MATPIVEIKHHLNKPTERYDCELVARGEGSAVLRYLTDRDYDLGPVRLERGTVTLAHYWSDRAYVLWDLQTPGGERIGWLCHICRPPAISDDRIEYTDLILDIWLWPDGRHVMLDEDELAECVKTGRLSEAEAKTIRETAESVVRDFRRIAEEVAETTPQCDNEHAPDYSWFEEHLRSDILPHWLASAPTDSGLFLPHLDRRWQRRPESYGTIVSQSRLLYNFSVGYELTGDDRYAKAVERGAQFLTRRLRDDRHGGWFWSCAEDGTVLDDSKDSYGHAFVVFGLSHAAQCLGDDGCRQAALDAYEVLTGPLRDEHGGLIPRASRDFSRRLDGPRIVNSQNPMMHFFEALLALGDACNLTPMYDAARSVADFLLSRPGREPGGALREVYGPDWSPLPTHEGGRIDIGHQFEWAFLLSAAVERGLPESYLAEAESLLEYGLRVGYDGDAGGIFADASLEGDVIEPSKGWWQQCEAARALMHFAESRGRRDLLEPLDGTVAFFKREIVDPEYGGWYAGHSRDKGSAWKVDYHVVAMCVEAMRLANLRRAPADRL